MWQRIWTWIRSHWLWMAGGAAGLLAIVGLLRGRRAGPPSPGSVPVAGLSSDQAQGLRDDAAATHAVEVAEADAALAAERAKIAAIRLKKRGTP